MIVVPNQLYSFHYSQVPGFERIYETARRHSYAPVGLTVSIAAADTYGAIDSAPACRYSFSVPHLRGPDQSSSSAPNPRSFSRISP